MRKFPATLPALAVSLVALAAAQARAFAQTPGNALVMAWNIDAISTFDPAQIGEVVTNELVTNTCDSLVTFAIGDEREVEPSFAESWEVSQDGQEITFHLRQGATFPSGNPVTAQDAAWSLHRVVHLGFGNAATLTEYGFTAENVETMITATDDHTLVMRLDRPYPVTLVLQAIAANRVAAILDRETIMANEGGGDHGNAYLTTRTECVGPYRLAQWNAGEAVILEANDTYWGQAPGLQRVFIRHVAEAGTQRLLLEQGDVDVARDLGPDDLSALDAGGMIAVERVLRPQLFFWTFNMTEGPFAEPQVRRAMRYLIDYDALQDSVMSYLGVQRASFTPIGSVGALDEAEGQPFELDLDRARELLAEAGYPDGFSSSVLIGTLPHSAPIAESIQQNAAQIGVQLSLERMANAQLFSRIRAREYQSGMLAWQTAVPDAHGMASRLVFNPNNDPNAPMSMYPSWRAGYFDEEVNARIDAALMESDLAARDAMYADLQRDIMEDGPMAIMFQMYNVAGVRPEIQNWTWNGFRTDYAAVTK